MIKKITSKDDLNRLLEIRNNIIYENTFLPAKIFRHEYNLFSFTDEALIMNPLFLDPLLEISKHMRFSEILYMVIEPDPIKFHSYSDMYGSFVFDTSATSEDIVKFSDENDTWSTNKSTLIPICSGIPDWCVYRDRTNCEVGIIAFKDRNIMEEFLNLDKEKIMMDIHKAIETVINAGFRSEIPKGFKEEFLKNYRGN